MKKIQTESDKLRKKIPLSNAKFKKFLEQHNLPFTCDGAGAPWPSHATLQTAVKLFFGI